MPAKKGMPLLMLLLFWLILSPQQINKQTNKSHSSYSSSTHKLLHKPIGDVHPKWDILWRELTVLEWRGSRQWKWSAVRAMASLKAATSSVCLMFLDFKASASSSPNSRELKVDFLRRDCLLTTWTCTMQNNLLLSNFWIKRKKKRKHRKNGHAN